MSNEANLHGHAEIVTTHEVHHDEHHVHHHKETFITKYIFSQDHKTIGKQFLITGIIWAIIGGLFSVLFRLQLGFPDQTFPILETFFGRCAKGGQIQPEFYYALITMHGTVLVFFVLTAGLSGTFANLLIPLQCGARDMASPFLNMLSYWFFFLASVVMISSLFVSTGPASGGWTMYPPLSALGDANEGSKYGDGSVADQHGLVCCLIIVGWLKLYFHHSQHANKGNEHDEIATYYLGLIFYSDIRCTYLSLYCFQGSFFCYLIATLEQVFT